MSVLKENSNKAVIDVMEVNPLLVKKVTLLKQAIDMRKKAIMTARYIETCRFAAQTIHPQIEFKFQPNKFSLDNLCAIRLGIYLKRLKKEVDLAIHHISDCTLCLAKGFYCEQCRGESDLIFPFQPEVIQCDQCFACFHKKCFLDQECGKCLRKQLYQNQTVIIEPSCEKID